MRQPMIGVVGPGELATAAEIATAYELGRQLAVAGCIVLTGGRNVGVMAAASQGAKSVGGLTVGILPDADRRQISEAVDIVIVTNMGQARNVINVLSCDLVIACGMGLGTASEVALALKSGKFVIFLKGLSESLPFFQRLGGSRLAVADDVEQAIAIVQQQLASA